MMDTHRQGIHNVLVLDIFSHMIYMYCVHVKNIKEIKRTSGRLLRSAA